MLRTCQSRIAFSKSKWYASAINTVFKPILLAHSRRSSSAVAVLEDTSLPEQQVQQGNDELVKVPMDNYRRCDGFRVYDGGRCQRLVRAAGAEPVFCYNHHPERQSKAVSKKKRKSPELKRILPTALLRTPENNRLVKGSSIFKTPNKLFDCSHLWLGSHLTKDVKASIWNEMMKPVNLSEKPGYIYVYTLQRGPRVSGKGQAYFKIGRTINPHRRMYQFYNMCDHEPRIVELFPSFPPQPKLTITNLEILDGDEKLDQLPKCPLPHRVEKLIHLELFSMFKKAGFRCSTCETEHREWIKINRLKHPEEDRLMTDHELWLLHIRPVIMKWIQYGVLASALAEAQTVVDQPLN